jgi:5-methylcytosine-specific restriction endonuclease McrA
MAKNTDANKRIAVKHVRDRAKSAYEKKANCYICNTVHDLELHHTHSITLLLNKWSAEKGYDISTDAGILAVRDEFIEEHKREIYDAVYTLCNSHHVKLHQIYGKSPALSSADKQVRWIDMQREKYTSGGTSLVQETIKASRGTFADFY